MKGCLLCLYVLVMWFCFYLYMCLFIVVFVHIFYSCVTNCCLGLFLVCVVCCAFVVVILYYSILL